MTTEHSQGIPLNALPVSPDPSSGTPGILTPLSTSPSDKANESSQRKPSPLAPGASRVYEERPIADEDTPPSATLLAHAKRSLSNSDDNGEAEDKDRSSLDEDDDNDDDDEAGEGSAMAPERPPMHRPTGGRSGVPLLKDERGRPQYESPSGSARPAFAARRSTFRSRSPDFNAKAATRQKYIYAGCFLLISLVSFVVQTETASYIQKELGWAKAYCML